MVGDSISALAAGQIDAAVAPSYAYEQSFISGSDLVGQLPNEQAIVNDPAGPPNKWIIELGTNDTGWYEEGGIPPDPNFNADYNNVIATAAHNGASCVQMVTIAPQIDTVGANAHMAYLAATYPSQLHLLTNPIYTQPGLTEPDGVHPNAAGEQALAAAYAAALAGC